MNSSLRAHDELEQRVEERTREVRALSAQLLSAQEEERKKIALDLHDGIGGLLSAIKYKIEAVPDFSQRGELVSMLQEASEECRRIQMALRPPLLDDLGLLATLSWLIREFQTRAPSLKIERRFTVEESAIPERLRMVIFRIVQEALNNITKYSGAEEVRLSLDKTKGALGLEVRDNGRGFQIEEALARGRSGHGFGLAGMRERTALSGGTLTIESAPAKGTIVRALWPENY